jgi:biopolymer transport protein TolQ
MDAESFSAFAIFMRADWVVKGVMIGLAAASLWSWAIIIDKFLRFTNLNREADAFEDEIDSGASLEDLANRAGDKPRHALPRMLQAAVREWRQARTAGPMNDTQAALLIQRIDRVLDASISREGGAVEEGLGTLAIVATASPFVGLFGTVWGIMHAFQAIAAQENTNLAVVAPSIAAASVLGSSTSTPTVRSGAEIMKMMSSTSITSTRGVTLISDSVARRRRDRRPLPPMAIASWAESAMAQRASVVEGAAPLSRSPRRRVTAADSSSAKFSSRPANLAASVEYLL